jgi:hypothetical protein
MIFAQDFEYRGTVGRIGRDRKQIAATYGRELAEMSAFASAP